MNDVDQIKQRTDIADFIREFIELKKAGRNFKANCPFHNEKSPSFFISTERQIWHCFGCGKGGDIFSFLMEYEKLTFSECLEFFAKRLGITLTRTPQKSDQEKRRERIFGMNHLAQQYYHFLLTRHSVGKKALAYLLEERGMNEGLIESFGLGYAPQSENALVKFLMQKKGYKAEELIAGGLAYQKGRMLSDFFKHRIIFPIHDHQGNIIAFSARALDATLPKYINTKETDIYRKRQSLYGIFQAKDSIKKEGKVLLVEGEFDVISAHKEGIDNVVAVKGTALTEEQIMLLKRYSQKILFCFDTDSAGIEAQKRSIGIIDRLGLIAHVVVLPSGKDPDELLRLDPGEFKKALKTPVPMYDFVITQAKKAFDTGRPEGKREFLKDTLPLISQIENEVVKEHYFKMIAGLLDTSLESITKESGKIVPSGGQKKEDDTLHKPIPLDEYFLALLFQSKDVIGLFKDISETALSIPFTTPSIPKILSELSAYSEQNQTFDSKVFATFLPPELLETYNKAFILPLPELSDTQHILKELRATVKNLESQEVKRAMQALSTQIQEAEKGQNEEKMISLQEKFSALAQRLKE